MSLILAHRGASGYQPEMTKAAYQSALDFRVDGLEVDVRLTKDDVLIAIHDRNTKRVSNKNLNVSNTTYKDLLDLNFYGEQQAPGNYQILRLAELIELCLSYDKKLILAIETKHPSVKSFKLEKELHKLLNSFKLDEGKIQNIQIILMSFNLFAVRSFKKLMPDVPRVMLVERNYPFLGWVPTPGKAQFVGPGIELLNKNPKLIDIWRRRGKKIFVWTVDQRQDVEWCLKEEIEIFVSNYPDKSLKIRSEFQ
jgi:glycerophosphoryl diester phosphodiesterase